MSIKPTIMKFGGTSVADATAFKRVANIVQTQIAQRPVVVVSAMSGFTDTLLHCFELSLNDQVFFAMAQLNEELERHRDVVLSFGGETAAVDYDSVLQETRENLRLVFNEAKLPEASLLSLKDQVVSCGEQLSSELLARVLQTFGISAIHVDARDVIVTDEEYTRANPLMVETAYQASQLVMPLVQAGQVPVLGGFIGSTASGNTTTLGRGGSDYSAAILGGALDAREIQIWTDVSGVLTADPRVVKDARTVPVLSYQEAAELAYFGAKVLHPKTIHPAVERSIPVRVCNSHAPTEPGTLVVAESEAAPQTVKAIAHKNGITTLQVTSSRMLGAYGFLRALFEVFDVHRTVVDVVTTSEVSVSLSVDDTSTLAELVTALEKFGAVEVEGHRTIISVIGEGLRNTSGIAAMIFSALNDINISMISFGASSINLTFMVEEACAAEAIWRLHRVCFESEVFEPVQVVKARAAGESAA